jgi:hypothetical protein
LLIDLKLGRSVDGLDTLRRLKNIDLDVPTVMLTDVPR